jgi:acyl-CoA thioester hydrolase
MDRIRIDLPEKFLFSTNIPIRVSDINSAKHLGHDRCLPIMEEARVQFFGSLGLTSDVMGGVALITADAGIIYKKQGFYGQTLKVDVAITDFSTKGCEIVFRLSDAATGEEMIRGKTGMLFFDYKQQKVVSVPDVFRRKIAERQSETSIPR